MLFEKRAFLSPNKITSAKKRALQAAFCCLVLLGLAVSAFWPKQVRVRAEPVIMALADLGAVPSSLRPGLPVRLIIEKIKVNTSIQSAGLTQSGNMAVPSQANSVGWYEYGSRPGEQGAAVLAGHLDGAQGKPDVFAKLHVLEKGDTFLVIDDVGKTITFVVTSTRMYNQSDKPSEVFTASDGAHVNLITCAGAWDNKRHLYTKRLVVFGERLS